MNSDQSSQNEKMGKEGYPPQDEELAQSPSYPGIVDVDNEAEHDAVFGAITEDGPNYRNVGIPLSEPSMIEGC